MSDPDLELTLLPLLGPGEAEVDCDECFALLDQYVELEQRGLDAAVLVPGMRAHLTGCPACAEEHESLGALLELEGATP